VPGGYSTRAAGSVEAFAALALDALVALVALDLDARVADLLGLVATFPPGYV
jgi:hypothetical protein